MARPLCLPLAFHVQSAIAVAVAVAVVLVVVDVGALPVACVCLCFFSLFSLGEEGGGWFVCIGLLLLHPVYIVNARQQFGIGENGVYCGGKRTKRARAGVRAHRASRAEQR